MDWNGRSVRNGDFHRGDILSATMTDFLIKVWDQFLLGHNIHSQTIRNKS